MGSNGCDSRSCSFCNSSRVKLTFFLSLSVSDFSLLIWLYYVAFVVRWESSRSPLGTTVAQIASRLLIVWYICIVYPQVSFRLITVCRSKEGRRETDNFSMRGDLGTSNSILRFNGYGLVIRRNYSLPSLRYQPLEYQSTYS